MRLYSVIFQNFQAIQPITNTSNVAPLSDFVRKIELKFLGLSYCEQLGRAIFQKQKDLLRIFISFSLLNFQIGRFK